MQTHANSNNAARPITPKAQGGGKAKKFIFKAKKSPESSQNATFGAAVPSRGVLSPLQTATTLSAFTTERVPPVNAQDVYSTLSDGDGSSLARVTGGATVNSSHGLRAPNNQSETGPKQMGQPPMSVTVKRDGSSVTKFGQKTNNPQIAFKPQMTFNPPMTFNPQMTSNPPVLLETGVSSGNLRLSSNPVNVNLSERSSSQNGTKTGKQFERYVPPSGNATSERKATTSPTGSGQLNCSSSQLRNSTQSNMNNQTNPTAAAVNNNRPSQLRNPSRSNATIPSKSTSVDYDNRPSTQLQNSSQGANVTGSCNQKTFQRSPNASGSGNQQGFQRSPNAIGSMNQQGFQKSPNTPGSLNKQGFQKSPNAPGSSVNRNGFQRSLNTTEVSNQTGQYQTNSASPMHASTPGYRTPSGNPPSVSSRYPGGTTTASISGTGRPTMQTPARNGNRSNLMNTPQMPRAYRGGGTTPQMPVRRGDNHTPHGGTTPRISRGSTATPQVPMLTPRVAQFCQTPSGSGSRNTMRTRARKFPGPAGVLPKLVSYS